MKILLTGSEGQIGRALNQQINKTNHNLLALNRDQLDITCKDLVKDVVTSFSPDIIINAAAYTDVDKAENNQKEVYEVNSEAVAYLAKMAKHNHAIFIHLSTDYVFSGEKRTPYYEDDLTKPCNAYGHSKRLGELAVINNCDRYIILRTSWVFGEGGHNFVKSILALSKKRSTLNIVNDQVGAPTYTLDIASAILKIANTIFTTPLFQHWGIYHYSGFPYTNWAEFAYFITQSAFKQKQINQQPIINPIPSSEYHSIAIRPLNSCLDCKKIIQQFDLPLSNWKGALSNIKKFNTP